jgi:predicted DNA binding CopG/RHH family protein
MARRPQFKNEAREREYWATHDSVGKVDWSKAERVTLPNLRPSTRTISLRLPESMLEALKLLAHQRDVPYQSLIKVFLAERIENEQDRSLRGVLAQSVRHRVAPKDWPRAREEAWAEAGRQAIRKSRD